MTPIIAPQYPWTMQAICGLIAAACLVAAVLYPDAALGVSTPLLDFEVSFAVLAILIGIAPVFIHRGRRKHFRVTQRICHRCEKPLTIESFALYCGEPVCQECAEFLEKIAGRKLERYTKSEPDHAHT